MNNIEWRKLLVEAINNPGSSSDTYCRFYNYSFVNRMMLLSQGLKEPVASFNNWNSLGRTIKKGEKSSAIYVPMIKKDKDGKQTCYGFRLMNCIFGLSQTTGPELEIPSPKKWNKEDALKNLNIEMIPFEHIDGNAQGYASKDGIAINPVAKYPLKTLIHEIAHKVMEHTESNSISEFQAETVAYIIMHEINEGQCFNASESRKYIQNWLNGTAVTEEYIKPVFSCVEKILKAGTND